MTRLVYFARLGDYIKVGSAADVHRRLRSLSLRPTQVKCPADLPPGDLELIGVMPGSYDEEFTAQCHLWEWRVEGEWFAATPEVMDWIDDHCWSHPLPEPPVRKQRARKVKPQKPAPLTPAAYGAHLAAAAPPLTDAQVEAAARILAADPGAVAAA